MPPSPEASSSPQIRCIVTSFEQEEQAADIIRTLVRERHIACGNILRSVRSIYIWQDKLEDTEEVIAILKTTSTMAALAGERLRELHPYDVPEILVLTPEAVETAYADWVAKTVQDHPVNFPCSSA